MDRLTILAAVLVAVAAMAVGVLVAPPDENTDRPAPPGAVELLTLRGDALSRAVDAVEDASGVRTAGVAVDGWMREVLLGERIFEQFVVGEDGWLFYRQTVQGACERRDPTAAVAQAASRLVAVGAAAELDVVVVVAPNKAAIYPQLLGPFEVQGRCDAEQARALTSIGAPVVTGLDEVLAVAALPDDGPGPAYFPTDTHWRHVAAAEASRGVFALSAPQLLSDLELAEVGETSRGMDLDRFAGRTVTVTEPIWALRPPGARVVERGPGDGAGTELIVSEGDGIPDRTVVMTRDSFGESMVASLASLGRRLHVCNCDALLDGRTVGMLAEAELLVVETVQRNAVTHLQREDAAGQLATALGARLSGRSVEVGSDDSLAVPAGGLLRFTFDGVPDEVRVLGPDGTVLRTLSILDGQVGALFVEDVAVPRITLEVDGATLTNVEHVALD